MTVKNAIERIEQKYPDMGRAQIIKLLDDAQKIFANEADLLETSTELSSISTNLVWSLPSNFKRLKSVNFYDSSGNAVEEALDYVIFNGNIVFYPTNGVTITGIPSTTDSVILEYKQKPTTITGTGSAFEVDEAYHEGVLAKAMEVVCELHNNYEGVNYWLKKYEHYKSEAKKDKSRGHVFGQARYYPFAGKFSIPKKAKEGSAATTTTPITSVGGMYDKYAVFRVESATESYTAVESSNLNVTPSISGTTITFTSSGEFSNDTFINSNNRDFSITSASSNEIVIEMPSGWGSAIVILYEL